MDKSCSRLLQLQPWCCSRIKKFPEKKKERKNENNELYIKNCVSYEKCEFSMWRKRGTIDEEPEILKNLP
jgi:hypothetical protein